MITTLSVLLTQTKAIDVKKVEDALKAKLDEIHRNGEFPGATAAIALPDGRTVAVAVGMADPAKSQPMKTSDRLLQGSIGKTYFAAVIMQLVQEGKLDLDAKIEKYVGSEPWFAKLPNANEITLRSLLNHTSGIMEHVQMPEFAAALKANPDKDWKPAELLAFVSGKDPLFEVGKGWSYADTNFIVAAMVAEKVTGTKMYDEIDRRLLKPYGLNETKPSISRTLPGLIMGHSMPNSPFGHAGPMIVDGKFVMNPQMEWAGGGFYSTTRDLAKWGHALFTKDVVNADGMKQMLVSLPARTGPNEKYGLGLQIRPSAWGETRGHSGWFPGYLSDMAFFPDKKVTLAVQFNTDEMRRIRMRPYRVLNELMGAVANEL